MNKSKQIYGVDISKDVFDVVNSAGKHFQFSNDGPGFKSFEKALSSLDLVVMEATGYYPLQVSAVSLRAGNKGLCSESLIGKEVHSNETLQG